MTCNMFILDLYAMPSCSLVLAGHLSYSPPVTMVLDLAVTTLLSSRPSHVRFLFSTILTLLIHHHSANCPYVTTVGATQLHGSTEVAANLSSGGFSDYFTTPSYQSAAVSSYIKRLGSKYAGRYNTSGRGIPDVSALGMNYLIEARGNSTLDDG